MLISFNGMKWNNCSDTAAGAPPLMGASALGAGTGRERALKRMIEAVMVKVVNMT